MMAQENESTPKLQSINCADVSLLQNRKGAHNLRRMAPG